MKKRWGWFEIELAIEEGVGIITGVRYKSKKKKLTFGIVVLKLGLKLTAYFE